MKKGGVKGKKRGEGRGIGEGRSFVPCSAEETRQRGKIIGFESRKDPLA